MGDPPPQPSPSRGEDHGSTGRPSTGGFLLLTHADTDLLALSKVVPGLPPAFPPVRWFNPVSLRSDEEIDAFLNTAVPDAEVIIVRVLGGVQSFRHGLDQLSAYAQAHDRWLVCLPGTDSLDPELTARSNVGVPITHEALAYFQLGGLKNYQHVLRFLSDHLLMTAFGYDPPEILPRHGVYHPDLHEATLEAWRQRADPTRPTLGVLFYRSHLLSGNTEFIDALVRSGEAAGANVLPVYAYSLKESAQPQSSVLDDSPAALGYFVEDGRPTADAIICTMSFALGTADEAHQGWSAAALQRLDVPVLQAITASISHAQWSASPRGLGPLDTAINVALPELDGRIITVPISFKEEVAPSGRAGPRALPSAAKRRGTSPRPTGASVPEGQELPRSSPSSPVVQYVPELNRTRRLVDQALRLIALRRKPNSQKRIAFILTNYAGRASRIGNAVGLDSPASLVRVLQAMAAAGYEIRNPPPDGDTLLQALIDHGSYDREVLTRDQLQGAFARVRRSQYQQWFDELPEGRRTELAARWQDPPGRHYTDDQGSLALAGLDLGNVFVAIQPPRGYGLDPAAIYHQPDLPPPHPYHALYRWLAEPIEAGGWGADAIVHLGKHGSLEWLPGKEIGLSEDCYPDLLLRDLPLVYPFIINNPGEGAQAKRRAHAVIIDHLTPPMTTAEGYEEIEELTRLVDEYYQLEKLDPPKLPLLQQQIWELIQQARLDGDLEQLVNWDADDHAHEWDSEIQEHGVPHTISDLSGRDFAHLVENINGYLCELTSAQIRDGLHVLGQPPTGPQLVDTLLALVRLTNLDVPSLRVGLAEAYGLDLDAILDNLGGRFEAPPRVLEGAIGRPLPTHADALEAIDALGQRLVEALARRQFAAQRIPEVMEEVLPLDPLAPWKGERFPSPIQRTLQFICQELEPNLQKATDEITNLLHALDGGYVPAGPSGAPTRGMAHVLPTGRNFYGVDPRAIPSLAAWRVGQQLADALLARHRGEAGQYPESVGISIWGTSTMRTHGEDVAEVLSLLGVRLRWQAESRRVIGIEVVPLEELGRPRIDVVCRISGFFRDGFPHLIELLDEAFRTVGDLDEPAELNHVRGHRLAEEARLLAGGASPKEAAVRAGYRIFGSKPGTYGAGILPLIDERNWTDAGDFAEAYVNWGGYAYAAAAYGVDARSEFRAALSGVQVAVKNQDNREHDIFDSDDYLQYHGGMIAAIRALSGKNPRRYFGDSADPARARVRDLKEEALRVFRTRVVNPKWLAGIQRHGYKGALELAATVDYLFGYDATAGVVDDWMYQRVAEAYALDPSMQAFFRQSNPWALRDIARRLLEAADRGLWQDPGPLRDSLEQTYLLIDGELEARAT